MTASIDIIVVNWNSGFQLQTCIESISRYGGGLVSKTIVIDNGSSDGSEGRVDDLSDVTVIRMGANLGFGKACNYGARLTNAGYILFLNPDAALHLNTLPIALAYMNAGANSDVGICGVQLLDETDAVSRSCTRFPSAVNLFSHAIGLDRMLPQLGHFMGEWDHAQTREVDHVIGAFFMVRREVFDTLSGFDERFFVYLEDLDFSYRAHQAGWRSIYLADAQAFHAGGGTSRQVKAHRLFYSLRSHLLYGFKHFPRWQAWALVAVTLAIEPVTRSMFALVRGGVHDVGNTLRAYGMLIRDLPAVLAQARRP